MQYIIFVLLLNIYICPIYIYIYIYTYVTRVTNQTPVFAGRLCSLLDLHITFLEVPRRTSSGSGIFCHEPSLLLIFGQVRSKHRDLVQIRRWGRSGQQSQELCIPMPMHEPKIFMVVMWQCNLNNRQWPSNVDSISASTLL